MIRIQELATEAKNRVPVGLVVDDWIKQYNEIFGRLIIDECVKVIHKQDMIPKGFFYPKGADIHELAIRKHFGVDE